MTPKPSSTTSAAEVASGQIRDAIVAGRLAPDEAVYEEEWAGRLGISRTPVREAIQELVARGILTRRGRTAHVFRPSLPELLEIYDIRLPLERLAAARCAEIADDALVADLEASFAKIRRRRSDSGWYTDHEAFHMRIFEGSGMPRLAAMIEALRSQSEPYVRLAVHVDQRFRNNSRVQHSSLVDAVRSRDPELAAAIVSEHLATSREKVSAIMQVAPGGFNVLVSSLRP